MPAAKMNEKQLRNRRQRIIQETAKEQEEIKKVTNIAKQSNRQASNYFLKLYLVLGTAVVVTIVAALNYTQPKLFKRRKTSPPYYFTTLYPPGMDIDKELPRFFRSYSVATPQNKAARVAMKRVVQSRHNLQRGNGNIQVFLKSWDETHIEMLQERTFCGTDWKVAYDKASPSRQESLLLWCLLATRVTDGIFLESVDMLQSALILARQRGIVVRSTETGYSTSYYVHPRRDSNELSSPLARVPSKLLQWMLANPEDFMENEQEAQDLLEEHLYRLVQEEEGSEYMVLDQVCQTDRPRRSVARECQGDSCCYFVVPDSYGGNLDSNAEV